MTRRKGRSSRLDEYMIRFDSIDASKKEDLCDLVGAFEFCMVVTDHNTGDSKRHYFDEVTNISKILGNYEYISDENSRYDIQVFDKKGDIKSDWDYLL